MGKLVLLFGLFMLPLAPAFAQAPRPPSVTLAPINCDALNQGTLICVRNATASSLVKITCSGFWGTVDLSIPHGIIKTGETTIVDFPSGKCTSHIVAFEKTGQQHKFDGFDTKNNTSLLIDADD